ncbi:MAG: hypothetical protein GY790_05210 [Bacteroidetes bacterium]|nr:hypothetical protein [Bacteroidota bacterium]
MTRMKKFKSAIFLLVLICLRINSLAQPLDPLSLHFEKDYQIRNFYNTSVTLSKLDFSQDLLNESKYPRIQLTSPGVMRRFEFCLHAEIESESSVQIGEAAAYLSPGIGQADMRVVTYEDGSTFFKNDLASNIFFDRNYEDPQCIYDARAATGLLGNVSVPWA